MKKYVLSYQSDNSEDDKWNYYCGTRIHNKNTMDKVTPFLDKATIFTETDFDEGVFVSQFWKPVLLSTAKKRK